MGEMRDSDWSRQNLLRSDWLVLKGATITTMGARALFVRSITLACGKYRITYGRFAFQYS